MLTFKKWIHPTTGQVRIYMGGDAPAKSYISEIKNKPAHATLDYNITFNNFDAIDWKTKNDNDANYLHLLFKEEGITADSFQEFLALAS